MLKIIRGAKHLCELAALRLLMEFVQGLDIAGADRFGAWLGRAAYRLLPSRVKVAEANLQAALGTQFDVTTQRTIVRNVFETVACNFVEFLRFPLYSNERIREMIRFKNPEMFNSLLTEGKGVIGVTPHFDNWDLVGASVAPLTRRTWFLTGRQSNQFVDSLFNKIRHGAGVGIISISDLMSARQVIGALRRNEVVCTVPDQHAASGHVTVQFFGRPVAALRGPALFAYRTGAPIAIAFSRRIGPSQHEGWIGGVLRADRSKSEEAEILRLTQEMFAHFESAIREYPSMWMWTHRRWKSPVERKAAVEVSTSSTDESV